MVELRVVSGARAGAHERFDKSVITIGRHPLSDFRFDLEADLDVSTRHAELRAVDGAWTIHDQESTNGTFVNGERVRGERRLHAGDTIGFGLNGPRLVVHVPGEASLAPAAKVRAQGTTERVAEAVRAETASLRRGFLVAVGLLIAAGSAGIVWWQRKTAESLHELVSAIERSDSASAAMARTIAAMRPRDSVFAAELAGRVAASRIPPATQRISSDSLALYRETLQRDAQIRKSIAGIDFAGIHDRNDAAVALIASDLDGTFVAGTAFGVSPHGLLVTNRHVVRAESGGGVAARRVRVLYANTENWLPAHVVRVSEDDDLALLQVDTEGSFPVVAGVSREGLLARVGAPIASIGYPHAADTPMEGQGLHITARTSTTTGTVSKRLDDVLQIDSYAGKGSSGSPVFDARGDVVAVVYGGAAESSGRIVYAVPAQRLAGFLGADGAGVLR
jgi:S1-C subfamily serine protease